MNTIADDIHFVGQAIEINCFHGGPSSQSFHLNEIEINGEKRPALDGRIVNPELSMRYSGLYHIQQDLREAIQALSAVMILSRFPREEDKVLIKALFSNTVISYCRAFASTEGRNRVKIDSKNPWINGDDIKFHRNLLELRNKYFAHSGDHFLNSANTFIVLDSKEAPSKVQLFCYKWELFDIGTESISEYYQHIERVLNRVTAAFEEIARKLELEAFRQIVGREPQAKA